MTTRTRIVALVAAALVAGASLLEAQTAIGTAFTYQGRLTDAGSPANGPYDLQFTLYDAASGGNTVGSAVTHLSELVTRSVFSVLLDFGGSAFTGSARWLEVGVRPGGTDGAYATIAPRHQITPTPYALDTQRFGGQLPASYQLRVSGTCNTGSIITAIAANGTVTCATISGSDIVSGIIAEARIPWAQTRVSGTCSVGSSIRAIAENGSVTCESGGSVPVNTTSACTASIVGHLRYNSDTQRLQFCAGMIWLELGLADLITPQAFGYFYVLSPPDAAATIPPGGAVPFPHDGLVNSGITRNNATDFVLGAIGVYEISWQVSITEAGQLVLGLNGVPQPQTVVGRSNGSSQIMGNVLIETTALNTVLTVRAAGGNLAALTVTSSAGGTQPVTGSLVIKRIR